MSKKNFAFTIHPKNLDLSKKWYVAYYIERKRIRLYGKINQLATRKERLKYADFLIQREIDKLRELEKLKRKQPTYNKLLREHLMGVILSKHDLRPKTAQSYTCIVNIFCKYCFDDVTKVNRYSMQEYTEVLRNQQLSNTTINFHVGTLKTLFNVLIEEGVIFGNPCTKVKKLAETRQTAHYYTKSQIAQLSTIMRQENNQLFLMCCFVYYCFIRPKSEARILRIHHIDLDRKRIFYSCSYCKE